MFNALRDKYIASVPLATETLYLDLFIFKKFFSNLLSSLPKNNFPLLRVLSIEARIFFLNNYIHSYISNF